MCECVYECVCVNMCGYVELSQRTHLSGCQGKVTLSQAVTPVSSGVQHYVISNDIPTSKFMDMGGRAVCLDLVLSVVGNSSTSAVSWDSLMPGM